jgi:hypothetical protein
MSVYNTTDLLELRKRFHAKAQIQISRQEYPLRPGSLASLRENWHQFPKKPFILNHVSEIYFLSDRFTDHFIWGRTA